MAPPGWGGAKGEGRLSQWTIHLLPPSVWRNQCPHQYRHWSVVNTLASARLNHLFSLTWVALGTLRVYCTLGICLCFYSKCCLRSPCQGSVAEWIEKAEKRRTILILPEPAAQVKWFTPGRKTLARLWGDFRSESEPRGLTPRLSISSRKFNFLHLRTKFLSKADASRSWALCWLWTVPGFWACIILGKDPVQSTLAGRCLRPRIAFIYHRAPRKSLHL